MKWSFYETWNKALEQREVKPPEPRQKIWASEIGGAYLDRFLKMKGVQQTNPPNARSLRKFEAGNILEWIVGLILKRAGVLINTQEWIQYQYEGLLPVSGRLDFISGGQPDYEKARKEIELLELPDFFNRATNQIIEHLKTNYPDGLEKIILEIKSCSSFMFERYEKHGLRSAGQHGLQLFHYLKAKDISEGHLVYISKDDLRMIEIEVLNPSYIEKKYKNDISTMTDYFQSDVWPPPEKEIIYNEDTFKFSTNLKIEYSSYLKLIYGYDEPIQYREKWDKMVASWNRTVGRAIGGKNQTDLNKKVKLEIIENGFDFDEIIKNAIEFGAKAEDEDD